MKRYNSFHPGRTWLDTDGKPIQAHGFSVVYSEKDQSYYWYGENKEKTTGGPFNKIWHWGVRCYASKDLYNWEDKGLLIPPRTDRIDHPLHPTQCMDRPHIIYCKKTGKYVAWLKIMGGTISQFMCILQADDFMGPYEIVHERYRLLQMDSGDFALAVDPDTEKAYIIYERPHFEIVTATLSDTYTEVTGEYSEHYKDRHPPFTREAPTFFRRNGKNYLITSSMTGYYPNPSSVCVFDDFHGKYEDLGNPCEGQDADTSFYGQFTCVLQIPGTDRYIAMADRWKPTAFGKWFSRRFYRFVEASMSNEKNAARMKPDLEPKTDTALPAKEKRHRENTSIATYVWLPVTWEGDRPVIRWQEEWRL